MGALQLPGLIFSPDIFCRPGCRPTLCLTKTKSMSTTDHCRESNVQMRVGSHESFLQLSSTIMKHGPNERKLSKTFKTNLSRFYESSCIRVDERQCLKVTGQTREREFKLSTTLMLVWFGLIKRNWGTAQARQSNETNEN